MVNLRRRYAAFALTVAVTVSAIVAVSVGVGPYEISEAILVPTVPGVLAALFELYRIVIAGPRETRRQRVYRPVLGRLLRLGPSLLTMRPVDYRWDRIGVDRDLVPTPIETKLDRLEERITELDRLNDDLDVALGLDRMDHDVLAGRTFPEAFVDGERVRIEFGVHTPADSVPVEEWVFVHGHALLAADGPADLRERLETRAERYDRTDVGPRHWNVWNRRSDGDRWEETVWAARDLEARTIWNLVREERETFEQREEVLEDVEDLRNELVHELTRRVGGRPTSEGTAPVERGRTDRRNREPSGTRHRDLQVERS
jgi:hypothetical protein